MQITSSWSIFDYSPCHIDFSVQTGEHLFVTHVDNFTRCVEGFVNSMFFRENRFQEKIFSLENSQLKHVLKQ